MKKVFYFSIIFSLVFLNAAGAVPRPKNGAQREYYPNGNLRLEVKFKDEKLVRKRAFYPNGEPLQDFIYKDGKPWVQKNFYEDGTLKSLWTKKSGVTKFYNPDGTLKAEFRNESTTADDLPRSFLFD